MIFCRENSGANTLENQVKGISVLVINVHCNVVALL
jgi:hypothetical protein